MDNAITRTDLSASALPFPAFTNAVTLADVESEIAYISGVASDGTLAPTSFSVDNGDRAHKWGQGVAGTPGGVISYAFDARADFSPTEMATFREALALWASVANVTFVEQGTIGAQITLARGTSGQAFTSITESVPSNNNLATEIQATITIDVNTPGFDLSGSFTNNGGYGLSTIVHEIGHALGLEHGGNYDGSVNPATQQFSQFDTRLWSNMSYILPGDASAKFYSGYTVTNTNWGRSAAATTFMPLDILAIQRLYGAASGGPLSGGQVFGFNSNISGAAAPFFDFTQNARPIITLYDSGANNTLDLSGYLSVATVDLRAGHFSSFAGLTNNLGIDFNTRIDSAVGTLGGTQFYVNSNSDTIVGNGTGNAVYFPNAYASYTLSTTTSYDLTVTFGSVVDTLTNVQSLVFADRTLIITPACFAAGTPILTDRGEVAVERLAVGDRVRTVRGDAFAPIKWIGFRTIVFAKHPNGDELRPLRIAAGAFADAAPRRDIWLSPEHCVLVGGLLIPVGCLDNGASIARDDSVATVSYFHIELETHDIVSAAGLDVETWRDTGNRSAFANAPAAALFPRFDPIPDSAPSCAPIVSDGPELDRIRATLGRRAETIGLSPQPELVLPLTGAGAFDILVPPGTPRIRLASPAAFVAGDRRKLGALVVALTLDTQPVSLSDPSFLLGFHRLECHDGTDVRWTNGDALLVLGPAPRPRRLSIRVAALAAEQAKAA